jgi:Ulp1 family protease
MPLYGDKENSRLKWTCLVLSFTRENINSCPQSSKNHWFLFVNFPADRQITIIDSLYDQGPWHVKNFDNIVKCIHDYKKSKEIPKYKWAWHMHPVVVDKQLNLDDCGVCTCLAIYCLVHGLDYRTMPTFLFANQGRIFVYYLVMGYQFDQDDSYNSLLDEVLGESTIVDDYAPPYRLQRRHQPK